MKLPIARQPTWMNVVLGSLGSWLLTTALTAIPAFGAERITFSYGPLQLSLSIDALEAYAKQGKITNEFDFYAQRANRQQLAQLRDLLSKRFKVSPTMVSQFSYSPIGETVLRRLGGILQTPSGRNGFYALRSALILAAADSEGLTVLNMTRWFPTNSIRLNLDHVLEVVKDWSELLKKRDAIVVAIKQEAVKEAAAQSQVNFSKRPDLRLQGPFNWQKKTLTLNDLRRDRAIPVTLYLPQLGKGASKQSAPVIVISHGLASDSNTFAYLAQHLAFYGFAVAVLEHPGSNAKRFQQFFTGLSRPQCEESSDLSWLWSALFALHGASIQGRSEHGCFSANHLRRRSLSARTWTEIQLWCGKGSPGTRRLSSVGTAQSAGTTGAFRFGCPNRSSKSTNGNQTGLDLNERRQESESRSHEKHQPGHKSF